MSDYKIKEVDFSDLDKTIKIAVITGEFNEDYTERLENINVEFLKEHGFNDISTFKVPGALEIPAMVQRIIEQTDAELILCFGVVVRGDTTHYDLVTRESARGLMNLSLQYSDISIINGILTCENFEQVEERILPVYALSGLKLLTECKKLD